jgi:hypothetical protein
VPWGNRYPMLVGESTAGRFVTTIHSINSGILKLSQLTPVLAVFRGMSGMRIPHKLEVADKLGCRLGIEFGFMSTTTNKAIAIKYGQDWIATRGLSYVLELKMDSLNRGNFVHVNLQTRKKFAEPRFHSRGTDPVAESGALPRCFWRMCCAR